MPNPDCAKAYNESYYNSLRIYDSFLISQLPRTYIHISNTWFIAYLAISAFYNFTFNPTVAVMKIAFTADRSNTI